MFILHLFFSHFNSF